LPAELRGIDDQFLDPRPQRVVLLDQETAMVIQRCALLLDFTKTSLLRDEFGANRWKLLT
jgi:hypothetical protein